MTKQETIPMSQFLKDHSSLKINSKPIHKNPHMENSANMDNWSVRLSNGENDMVLFYSKGIGLRDKFGRPILPQLAEVLDCLASDASTIENASCFEDWANDLGYDPDSRKHEKIYNICIEQAKELKVLLGNAYEVLLWNVERL